MENKLVVYVSWYACLSDYIFSFYLFGTIHNIINNE